MSKQGAVAAMAVLTAAFHREVPEPTLRMYVKALTDLPDRPLLATAEKLVLTSKWLPTIAEIREAVIRYAKPSLLPPSSTEAWSNVVRNTKEGRYSTPEWAHELIGDTVSELGGFTAMCNSSSENMRKRFESRYREKASLFLNRLLEQPDLPNETLTSSTSNPAALEQ